VSECDKQQTVLDANVIVLGVYYCREI